MKRIDVIKQEVCDYVQNLSAGELYIVLSVLEDYHNVTGFPELKERFTCIKCIELFGTCSDEDIEPDKCVKRFQEYVNDTVDMR